MALTHARIASLIVVILTAAGCLAAAPDGAAPEGAALDELASLGVAAVRDDGSHLTLLDGDGAAIGEATRLGAREITVSLGGHVASQRWDDATMIATCDGASVSLVRDASGAWQPDPASPPGDFAACTTALAVGRAFTGERAIGGELVEADALGAAAGVEALAGPECHTSTTWYWNAHNNCGGCLRALGYYGSCYADSCTTSCSYGYLSVSCSYTYCNNDAALLQLAE